MTGAERTVPPADDAEADGVVVCAKRQAARV